MAVLNEVYNEATKLIRGALHSDGSGMVMVQPEASIKFVPCKNFRHGDIVCTSRDVAELFIDQAKKDDLHDRLLKSHLFRACEFDQQGHPRLSLSRSVLFQKCIGEVAASRDSYGCPAVESRSPLPAIIVHLPGALPGSECSPHSSAGATTIDEGRVMLAAGLLCGLLRCRGHVVTVTCPPLHSDDLPYEMLRPYVAIEEKSFEGKMGERDLQTSGGDGCPSQSTAVADGMSTPGPAARTVVHVVPQRCGLSVRQAVMSAAAVVCREQASHDPICLVTVSGVLCTGRGVVESAGMTLSLSDIVRFRTHQMRSVYSMRHGRMPAEGLGTTTDQDVGRKMAEAVVKFEVLSTDLNSPVKIDTSDSGVGLDRSFVMYNYARVTTLLEQFQRKVEGNEYPPLPPVEGVDFSLLSDTEEWDLLCGYVLLYPQVVGEAATFRPARGDMEVTVPLKKICLFLTRLSHTFSAYYSRVKILLAPEAHLVHLIHARVHLMRAIQQVMKNGLALLAIDPIGHL